jgi:hypothetical protein
VSGGETGAALLILRERRLFAFEMDRFFTLKDGPTDG